DFPSDLQPSPGAEAKVLHQRGIEGEIARPQQRVPTEVAEAIRPVSVLRHGKRGWIEPAVRTRVGHFGMANQVWPPLRWTCHAQPSDRADVDVEIRSRLHRHD